MKINYFVHRTSLIPRTTRRLRCNFWPFYSPDSSCTDPPLLTAKNLPCDRCQSVRACNQSFPATDKYWRPQLICNGVLPPSPSGDHFSNSTFPRPYSPASRASDIARLLGPAYASPNFLNAAVVPPGLRRLPRPSPRPRLPPLPHRSHPHPRRERVPFLAALPVLVPCL